MCNVATDLDKVSIGIEVVGYHNKPLTAAQIAALRELLRQLQAIYQVPDQRVLPHSMVAYGRPNRWHPHSHRGRKRCAMLMAQTSLRRQLGLTDKPAYDPDVRAGRLRVADPYLERILYGPDTARPEAVSGGSNVIAKGRSAWDIAREKYNAASTVYTFPGGKVMRGNEITQWNAMPSGTRVTVDASDGEGSGDAERVQVIGRDGASAQTIAGEEWNRSTTLYFLANQRVLQGDQLQASDVSRLVAGTRMLVGYTHGGRIAAKRSAFDICGPRWNLPSTFYRLPDGRLLHGGEIDERGIPNGTLVFFQQ